MSQDLTDTDERSYRPLLGFLVASSPLAISFMGWGGAGGNGAATIGLYYFFGSMLQVIGSILEWFIGNTFPFVVFGSFGKMFPNDMLNVSTDSIRRILARFRCDADPFLKCRRCFHSRSHHSC